MATLIVSAEGQIALDKDLLEHLGVQCGQQVSVEKLSDGRLAIKACRPKGSISDTFGFLRREGSPSLSIDEINEAAALSWAGQRKP
ncbi:antitoxin component of MazEF toxin-antitoxin module [Bradyrhizobium sp. AZCC 1588]|uniref:AbrB/MazE/SpoVT family DNA-binding domain-containing protein n=1 Tax=unclassified Bradyrhizobium TaxID=2631580 RepID=UPI002FF10822